MPRSVYLDYNATTPVDDAVFARMKPYFTTHYGNAASGHSHGWRAEGAVDVAREQVAGLLRADPERLTFTSGATEALNMAIKGVAQHSSVDMPHIVTVATEHKAVLESCRALEQQGTARITYCPVDAEGRLAPDTLARALTDNTVLVAVMHANNETGVLHPIDDCYDVVRSHRALFLTDATQALGKLPVEVQHADLLVGSAHKLYGPKGIGVLYRRAGVQCPRFIDGGGQERGLRGGTLNVPAVVGFGAAAALAEERQPADAERWHALQATFESALQTRFPDIRINGDKADRLPQTTNVTLPGTNAERLMQALRTVSCATGSACASTDPKPSHVLRAMGHSPAEAHASLRFSAGRDTTEDDLLYTVDVLEQALPLARASQPAQA
ncbi:MAG: cysteine desulfurase family protein [Longimonas sp.]|uniref:cysteine desulfurase family protein n=1 Tax=Longimonas sp. TaxID=2039626 RepID=UPI003344C991